MSVLFTINPPRRGQGPSGLGQDMPARVAPEEGDPYHERLRRAHALRITTYVEDRERLYEQGSAAAQYNLRADEFPTVTVPEPVGEQVAISTALFPQLFDLYVLHGWPAITAVDAAFPEHARPVEGGLPGGTRLPTVWTMAWDFFAFTRDLLGLAVRHELTALEDLAAAYTTQGLKYGTSQVTATIDTLQIRREELRVPIMAAQTNPVGPWYAYPFGNGPLSAAVHQKLITYLTTRDQYILAMGSVDWALGQRFLNARHNQSFVGDESLSGFGDAARADAQRLAPELAKAKKALEDACPLAFLVSGTLSSSAPRHTMEDQFGKVLYTLKGLAEPQSKASMGGKLPSALRAYEPEDPEKLRRSRLGVKASRPGRDAGTTNPPDDDTGWQPFMDSGPEWTLVSTAAQHLDGDPGWLPLLHEQVWHKMLTGPGVPSQSFTYFVAFHYRIALLRHQERAAAQRSTREKFWQALDKLGALLSLAALAGPLAPAVALIGGLASVAVTAHSVMSVLDQLTALDTALAKSLAAGPQGLAAEAAANVGALVQLRAELAEDAAQRFLLDAIVQHAAHLPRLKEFVLLYGHYQDVETLLEPFDDAEETIEDDEAGN
ncbi:hypothetical protein [Streptomyces avermitilis]|uniref:hypothetical protein n=1 Tax=Streptomyces avermitilis TaxID=33903 RepID=UPI0036852CD6